MRYYLQPVGRVAQCLDALVLSALRGLCSSSGSRGAWAANRLVPQGIIVRIGTFEIHARQFFMTSSSLCSPMVDTVVLDELTLEDLAHLGRKLNRS
jgi:hypothetical protein